MKLIVAIVQAADARGLLNALVAEGHRATKIGSTGGFLSRGNVTLLVGVDDEQVDGVLDILRRHCHRRREVVSPVVPVSNAATARGRPQPVQVEVGGTTVFVLDVERFQHAEGLP